MSFVCVCSYMLFFLVNGDKKYMLALTRKNSEAKLAMQSNFGPQI